MTGGPEDDPWYISPEESKAKEEEHHGGVEAKRLGKRQGSEADAKPPPKENAEVTQFGPGPIKTFELGNREAVRLWAERAELVRDVGGKHEDRHDVLKGRVMPVEQLDVEGDRLFSVDLGGNKPVTMDATEIFKSLQRGGRTVGKSYSENLRVLNTILYDATEGKVRHVRATLGIYADPEGRLELCTAPHPVKQEQEEVCRDAGRALKRQTNAGDVQGYLDFATKFRPHEVLPAMGLGAIAPFALPLRERGVLVPHWYAWSPQSGLGKSRVAEAFSERLYARSAETGDALNSPFRFPVDMEAAGLPLCVNEADRLDPRKVGPALKTSAEQAILGKRGTPDLGHVTYRSRGVFLFTGNALSITSRPELARVLVSRFDDSAYRERRMRAARSTFDALFNSLPPVGFELVRAGVERFPTIGDLLKEIERTRGEIEENFLGPLSDTRRAQAHAVMYVGLKIWEHFARKVGLSWTCPTISAFVRDVVVPIEGAGSETGALALQHFQRWWEYERQHNVDRSGLSVGQGVSWIPDSL